LLLDTEDAELVEHTGNDSYWGDGGNGLGRNQLGKTLMKVRSMLRNREPLSALLVQKFLKQGKKDDKESMPPPPNPPAGKKGAAKKGGSGGVKCPKIGNITSIQF
jgi:hypothetical protein